MQFIRTKINEASLQEEERKRRRQEKRDVDVEREKEEDEKKKGAETRCIISHV